MKEKQTIAEKARKAKVTMYSYIREAALKATVVTPLTPEGLAAFKAFTAEVRHIGINLNIIARKANSNLTLDYATDIENVLADLNKIKEKYYKDYGS